MIPHPPASRVHSSTGRLVHPPGIEPSKVDALRTQGEGVYFSALRTGRSTKLAPPLRHSGESRNPADQVCLRHSHR